MIQMFGSSSQDIGRPQYLPSCVSLVNARFSGQTSTYMRRMVMKLKVMVYDGVVGMIELQKMFERPSFLLL